MKVGVIPSLHMEFSPCRSLQSMGAQSEQEGAEHTALGGSGVEHQSGGGVTSNLDYLGSVCEEVQYPVAECCTQAQSAVFSKQFHGVDCAEC